MEELKIRVYINQYLLGSKILGLPVMTYLSYISQILPCDLAHNKHCSHNFKTITLKS